MKILIIDNYDSFTFNLYQFFGTLIEKHYPNGEVKVVRNDEIDLAGVRAYQPDRIVISPGPGNPQDPKYFGVCAQVIKELGPTIPLLGVCLGMQGLSYVFGAEVVHANRPMHGKISPVLHSNSGVFAGLPQKIEIMRYHSLVVKTSSLPPCLEVTSVVIEEGMRADSLSGLLAQGAEIMGVRHKEFPIYGIQFHPESFGTEGGMQMLFNFLKTEH